ncbi:MAG TPA: hypothetical protein VK821_14005 [Dehalococcoidia bacterium]|nr:hypothetical protein [Dehalococcoidia bacterium]
MATRIRQLFLAWLAIVLAAGFGITGAQRARAADTTVISMSQATKSYMIDIGIGPLANVMTPNQAKGATSGQVLVDPPQATVESIREAILPADHYVEVSLHRASTGALMTARIPVMSVRNLETGRSYVVDELVAMYDVTKGQDDIHFGRNVYLPAGTYDITVWAGRDRTVFTNVSVTGDYVRGDKRG